MKKSAKCACTYTVFGVVQTFADFLYMTWSTGHKKSALPSGMRRAQGSGMAVPVPEQGVRAAS